MKEIQSFNFHDLIGIQVISEVPEALHYFEEEYGFAKGPLPEDVQTIRLHWRKRVPLNKGQSGFKRHRHKILARWSYRISFSVEGIEIEVSGNRFAIPMVLHMLIHPALRYLCSLQRVLMLHSSAVARSGKSIVFTGAGGTGKTTASSMLLARSDGKWELHADDYVFITETANTLAYLTRSHLYRDLLCWVPEIRFRLTTQERIQLEILGRIREVTRDGLKWPVRLTADRLWPDLKVTKSARLSALVVLNQGTDEDFHCSIIQPDEELIDFLIDMNFFEARHFIRLVEQAPEPSLAVGWLGEWKRRERDILKTILRTTSVYRMEIPQDRFAPHEFERRLSELITPLVEVDVVGDQYG